MRTESQTRMRATGEGADTVPVPRPEGDAAVASGLRARAGRLEEAAGLAESTGAGVAAAVCALREEARSLRLQAAWLDGSDRRSTRSIKISTVEAAVR